jgi:hypothetical protein
MPTIIRKERTIQPLAREATYHESLNDRLRREREERHTLMLQDQKASKSRQWEMVGLMILAPIVLFALMYGYATLAYIFQP